MRVALWTLALVCLATVALAQDPAPTPERLFGDPVGGGIITIPSDVDWLTLSAQSGLSDERVFTCGVTMSCVDAGAGGAYTVAVDQTAAFTWTGEHDFGGGGLEIENSPSLPGSCTVGQLFLDTDATSGQQLYACEGGTFVMQSGTGSPGGSVTHVQYHDTGGVFGGDAGMTYNDAVGDLTLSATTGTLHLNDGGPTSPNIVWTTTDLGVISFVARADDDLFILESSSPTDVRYVIKNTSGDLQYQADLVIDGDLGLGDDLVSTVPANRKFIVDGDEDEVQVLIQGFSGQTEDLLTIQNSAATDLVAVGADGGVEVGLTTLNPTAGSLAALEDLVAEDTLGGFGSNGDIGLSIRHNPTDATTAKIRLSTTNDNFDLWSDDTERDLFIDCSIAPDCNTEFRNSFGDHNVDIEGNLILDGTGSEAAAGRVRLGNAETVAWRNAADSADLALTVDATDDLQFDGNDVCVNTGAGCGSGGGLPGTPTPVAGVTPTADVHLVVPPGGSPYWEIAPTPDGDTVVATITPNDAATPQPISTSTSVPGSDDAYARRDHIHALADGALDCDSVTGCIPHVTGTPVVDNAIVIFDATDAGTFGASSCTALSNAIDCPANATTGGCVTLKERSDAGGGPNFHQLCVSDSNIPDQKWTLPDQAAVGQLESDASGVLSIATQSKFLTVKKATAGVGAIAKGVPVCITGETSDVLVEVADADSSGVGCMPAVGVAWESINHTAGGRVLLFGEIDQVDVSDFSPAPKPLYVSAGCDDASGTPETCLRIDRPPNVGDEVQKIGTVTKANASGSFVVSGAGRSNDVPNLENTKFWLGNGSNVATAVTMTGDVALNVTGTTTIQPGAVDISTDTNLAVTAPVVLTDDTVSIVSTVNKCARFGAGGVLEAAADDCSGVQAIEAGFALYVDVTGTNSTTCGPIDNKCRTASDTNGAYDKITANNDNGFATCSDDSAQGCGRCSDDGATCNHDLDCLDATGDEGLCSASTCSSDSAEQCAFQCSTTSTIDCFDHSDCPPAETCLNGTGLCSGGTCASGPHSGEACSVDQECGTDDCAVSTDACLTGNTNSRCTAGSCTGPAKPYTVIYGAGLFTETETAVQAEPPGWVTHVGAGFAATRLNNDRNRTCRGGGTDEGEACHSVCSVTETTFCMTDADCPQGDTPETCNHNKKVAEAGNCAGVGAFCTDEWAHDLTNSRGATYYNIQLDTLGTSHVVGGRGGMSANSLIQTNVVWVLGGTGYVLKGPGNVTNVMHRSTLFGAFAGAATTGVYFEQHPQLSCTDDATQFCTGGRGVDTGGDCAAAANCTDRFCYADPETLCKINSDCPQDSDCTGNLDPYLCCTGSGTGTCSAQRLCWAGPRGTDGLQSLDFPIRDTLLQCGIGGGSCLHYAARNDGVAGTSGNIFLSRVRVLTGEADPDVHTTGLRLEHLNPSGSPNRLLLALAAVELTPIDLLTSSAAGTDVAYALGADTALGIYGPFTAAHDKRLLKGTAPQLLRYDSATRKAWSGGSTDLGTLNADRPKEPKRCHSSDTDNRADKWCTADADCTGAATCTLNYCVGGTDDNEGCTVDSDCAGGGTCTAPYNPEAGETWQSTTDTPANRPMSYDGTNTRLHNAQEFDNANPIWPFYNDAGTITYDMQESTATHFIGMRGPTTTLSWRDNDNDVFLSCVETGDDTRCTVAHNPTADAGIATQGSAEEEAQIGTTNITGNAATGREVLIATTTNAATWTAQHAGTDITADLEEEGAINATAVTGNCSGTTNVLTCSGTNTAGWSAPGGGSGPLAAYKTADECVDDGTPADCSQGTGTTLQNDDHLTFAIDPNTPYILEGHLEVTVEGVTPDMKLAINCPTGANVYGHLIASDDTPDTSQHEREMLSTTCGTASGELTMTGGGSVHFIDLYATVTIGSTDGSVTLQWAQNTADNDDVVVKQGSHMTLTPMNP